METSLNVYDYPEPLETKERHIKVKIFLTQEAEYDIPDYWDDEDIKQDIEDNINYIMWNDVNITEIEVS